MTGYVGVCKGISVQFCSACMSSERCEKEVIIRRLFLGVFTLFSKILMRFPLCYSTMHAFSFFTQSTND